MLYESTMCAQGQNAQGLHLDSAAVEQLVDLRPYMNTSPTPVPETFSLDRAYRMFTQLGLRHLVVVDPHNHVKGIVTRKVGPEAPCMQCGCPPHGQLLWQRMPGVHAAEFAPTQS